MTAASFATLFFFENLYILEKTACEDFSGGTDGPAQHVGIFENPGCVLERHIPTQPHRRIHYGVTLDTWPFESRGHRRIEIRRHRWARCSCALAHGYRQQCLRAGNTAEIRGYDQALRCRHRHPARGAVATDVRRFR